MSHENAALVNSSQSSPSGSAVAADVSEDSDDYTDANHENYIEEGDTRQGNDTETRRLFRRSRYQPLTRRVRISRPIFTQTNFDARYSLHPPQAESWWRMPNVSVDCVFSALFRLLPFIGIIRAYRLSDFCADIVAGATVGIMNIPQGMAYSMLADLPPVYGLYLGFFPLLVYFLFGTSRQASFGTFAISSLMVAAPVNRLSINVSTNTTLDDARIQAALSVSMLAGLIQLLLGILHFGFVSVYLSTPLVSGFTTGAAFHVMTSQVPAVFGINIHHHPGFFKLIRTYMDLIRHLSSTNGASLLISMVCIVLLLLFRFFVNKKLAQYCRLPVPIELLLVVVGTITSKICSLQQNYGVEVVGRIPSGLRKPELPAFRLFPLVLNDAVLLAVVMYACSFSICKTYANKHKYILDANQELIASGLVNSVCPIFGCYFSCASLSRSQVQDDMGGRTQVASLIAAALMLLVLLLLGPLFCDLPTSVLASIIIVALKGLFFQFRDALQLYRISRYDFTIWLVSFMGVIVGDVSYGLMIGFAYSLLTVVCRTQTPNASILGRLPMTDIYKDCRNYSSAVQIDGVAVFRFDGALYFASADHFRNRLAILTKFDTKQPRGANSLHHIILDCSGINYIDSVGATTLNALMLEYKQVGVTILLACCKHQLRRMRERSEFASDDAMYISVHDAVLTALDGFPNQKAQLLNDIQSRSNEEPREVVNFEDLAQQPPTQCATSVEEENCDMPV